MKLSAGTIGLHAVILIWCLFMGVTAISIGVGAIWPPLNQVAKPFVCPNGQMIFHQETSNPLPGTTYTTATWTCTDNQTGEPKELDIFAIALPAGLIYGLVLEVVVLLIMWYVRRRNPAPASQPAAYARPRKPRQNFNSGGQPAPHAAARMRELQSLRDQSLISPEEFEKKRAEILKDV